MTPDLATECPTPFSRSLARSRLGFDGTEAMAWPVWFGQEGRPAFGWFHSPLDGCARAGVVICPPVGQEYIDAHYGLRMLAERLTHAGLCCLRFDYDGTGDSAGSNSDHDRVGAWLRTVREAVALVRATGVGGVSLVGMRLGATLAARVAADLGGIDQVVLWDPCASGRRFLREQHAISMVKLGAPDIGKNGSVEIPGVSFDGSAAREIGELSLSRCPGPLARRVLVLTRADRPLDASLVRPELATQSFCHEDAVGQHEFMDRYPPHQQLPRDAIARVVGWLSEGALQAPARLSPPPPAGARAIGQVPSGQQIIETPVSLPPLGLFGIMTHPEGALSSSQPTAVFINVANQHHIGPTRLWVELARQWCSTGTVSMRLDLSGLGDSPSRPGEDRWVCHKPEAFDDVAEALTAISPSNPSNAVLIGLCSSGTQALESALALGLSGAIAINPLISVIPAERRIGMPLDRRRRVILPKDEVSGTFREGGRLSYLRERLPNLAWRARTLSSPGRRSGRWLSELVAQGTDTFLLCGDDEIRPILNGTTKLQLWRLRETGRLRVEHFPGLQHDLFLAEHRDAVARLLSEHFASRFGLRQP